MNVINRSQVHRKLEDAKQDLGRSMLSCHFSEGRIRVVMTQILDGDDLYKIAAVIISAQELHLTDPALNLRFFNGKGIVDVPILDYATKKFKEKVNEDPTPDTTVLIRSVLPYLHST